IGAELSAAASALEDQSTRRGQSTTRRSLIGFTTPDFLATDRIPGDDIANEVTGFLWVIPIEGRGCGEVHTQVIAHFAGRIVRVVDKGEPGVLNRNIDVVRLL